MGLFDGAPEPAGATGASADIAAILGLPVILVLDVSGQAQTAAAIAKGCASLRSAHPRRRRGAQQGRQRAASAAGGRRDRGAGPAGARRPAAPARHRPAGAPSRPRAGRGDRRQHGSTHSPAFVAAHVDLDALVALAAPHRTLAARARRCGRRDSASRWRATRPSPSSIRICVRLARGGRRDRLLLAARRRGPAGASRCLLAARRLSRNCTPAASPPRAASSTGSGASRRRAPFMANAAATWFSAAALTDAEGVRHEMAGLLGVETSFHKRRMTLGYRRARACRRRAAGRARRDQARPRVPLRHRRRCKATTRRWPSPPTPMAAPRRRSARGAASSAARSFMSFRRAHHDPAML